MNKKQWRGLVAGGFIVLLLAYWIYDSLKSRCRIDISSYDQLAKKAHIHYTLGFSTKDTYISVGDTFGFTGVFSGYRVEESLNKGIFEAKVFEGDKLKDSLKIDLNTGTIIRT